MPHRYNAGDADVQNDFPNRIMNFEFMTLARAKLYRLHAKAMRMRGCGEQGDADVQNFECMRRLDCRAFFCSTISDHLVDLLRYTSLMVTCVEDYSQPIHYS